MLLLNSISYSQLKNSLNQLAKLPQPMNNCGGSPPFDHDHQRTPGGRFLSSNRADTKLADTIIDSVTDNKHYFYR